MTNDGKLKKLQPASRVVGRADRREREFNHLMFGFTLTTIVIFFGLIVSLVIVGLILLRLFWPKL
jgi:hypothetical protein